MEGRKPALVASLADPKGPHKAALRVVAFSHVFPLGIDVG
jgi:hypothetical protein